MKFQKQTVSLKRDVFAGLIDPVGAGLVRR